MVDYDTVIAVEDGNRFGQHGVGGEHHAVPDEVAVRHHGVLYGDGRVGDGEVQCNHGVAATLVGEDMCVITAHGEVGVLVPVETVVSQSGGVAGVGVVDDEVQCHDRIAAVGGSKRLRIISRLGVNIIVPRVTVACGCFDKLSHRGIDSQVQCHNGVTTRRIRNRPCIVAALCEVGLLVPVETVAGHGGGIAGVGVFHGKMQCNNRITSVGSGECLRIIARLGVNIIVPRVTVACGSFDKLSHRGIDSQVQCHNGVTTRRIRNRPCVVTALCDVGLLVPVETVASNGGGVAGVGVVHGKMQ